MHAIFADDNSSHIFTELCTFYAPEGNSGASGFYPVYVFVRV